jgi:hypothetical protein
VQEETMTLLNSLRSSHLIAFQYDKGEECDDPLEPRQGGDCMSEAEIDYNVMASFPASDPPSWTLGVTPHKTCSEEFGETPSSHDPSHQNEPPD